MTRDARASPAVTTRDTGGRVPGGRVDRGNRGRRLSPLWRKALLTTHMVTSVGLLGADAAVLALVCSGWGGSEPLTVYPAAHLLGQALIVPLALLALTSGVAIGVLTPWGLLRHWWILIKFVLTAGGTVLALFVLVPTLDAAADTAIAGLVLADPFGLVKDSGGACGVLIVTVLLAYDKPFGRLRGRHRRTPRR
jgi:hypothetical protein